MRHLIPFDDAVSFHQGAGMFGALLAVVHSLCHIANFISSAPLHPPTPVTLLLTIAITNNCGKPLHLLFC